EGRIKSVYSIYRKMYNQNKSFDEIYDFYALRIIVNTELECYTVLGIIHEMYNSIPGRFKDYISTPKPNLYRSLHTTVIGHEGIPFEVQIRTKEMHEIAEYGIAAHWKYKSGSSAKDDMDKKLEWVSKLIETESDTKDPDEFMNAIKTDIFHDEVFVFTPKGDVISLPQGATVIDFAFFIHSAIGCRMTGAKINGAIVPIDHVLNNGEIVEIQTTNSDKGPSRDWLNIVKTSEARNKIRQWFKKEKRADNIVVGRSMVETEMRKYGRGLSDEDQAEIIENVASKTGYGSVDDLYNSLGYGGIPLSKILPKLADEYKKKQDEYQKRDEGPEELPARLFTQPDASKGRSTGKGVIIDGEGGMQVKFARCCNPLPGDSIVGFVTKGFGISVHKIDCPNILQAAKTEEGERRLVSARWSDDARGADTTYETMLQIFVEDRIGVIAELCAVLAEMRVQIVQINSTNASTGNCVVNIKILCRNREHYEAIVGKLKTLKAVRDVNRGFA
ncbi:MAG: bifunctional (p)ppGpp synthetase/guanosine-3',5'-bis(diphosphate) 3'-pyrophosphohydrolase, partial [Clostridia bacterium]|nr:bifunctional (p)ppGpp synthetase/guanosine-3',5'-bis(diphosphate) 3'-pyrophosphohydrolase [Clostridia bacterium]